MISEFGTAGENIVKAWLIKRGCRIISTRDIETRKAWGGPSMESEGFEPVLPDFLVIQPEKLQTLWMEVKRKTRFSWHAISRCWVTGIDEHYLEHYVLVGQSSKIPVWLFFLHLDSKPSQKDLDDGCPAQCPTGLFAQEILRLAARTHHTSANHGKGGMVYWAPEAFSLVATSEDLEPYLKAEGAGR
jgi:hypothetical protein